MKEEREQVLAIPFNNVLGYCCPICKGVGIGAKWAKGTNYCPCCGQRVKLISVETGDWALLMHDCKKIPNVFNTDVVTTQLIAVSGGFERDINGVYLERMRKRLAEKDQVHGQMSIFDLEGN